MSRKKFRFVVLCLIIIVNCPLFAQVEEEQQPENAWKKEVVGNLNFTQTGFDNWAQGGENTLAWQLNINSKFVKDHQNYNWSNTGKISFGKTKVGDVESRKSIDEIKLESVFTYILGTYVNPFVAVTGVTQFASGFKYAGNTKTEISDFMDPGYFTQSIGAGFSPYDELNIRLGLALKETVTRNFPVPYADDPKTLKIEKTKTEVGMESVTDFSRKFSENVLLTSKLELFSNLERFDEIDVRWDNIFTAKVSKYFNVSLNIKLFYDKDISKKRQLEQSLALGLTYSLF